MLFIWSKMDCEKTKKFAASKNAVLLKRQIRVTTEDAV